MIIFLWGALAKEHVQLLADLREGRLVPANGPVSPSVQAPVRLSGNNAPVVATAPIDAKVWAEVETAIRDMRRPQLETNTLLANARRQLSVGVSADDAINYALDGRP